MLKLPQVLSLLNPTTAITLPWGPTYSLVDSSRIPLGCPGATHDSGVTRRKDAAKLHTAGMANIVLQPGAAPFATIAGVGDLSARLLSTSVLSPALSGFAVLARRLLRPTSGQQPQQGCIIVLASVCRAKILLRAFSHGLVGARVHTSLRGQQAVFLKGRNDTVSAAQWYAP